MNEVVKGIYRDNHKNPMTGENTIHESTRDYVIQARGVTGKVGGHKRLRDYYEVTYTVNGMSNRCKLFADKDYEEDSIIIFDLGESVERVALNVQLAE